MILLVGEAPNSRGAGRGLDMLLCARALGEVAAYRADWSAWLRGLVKAGHWAARFMVRTTHENLIDVYPGPAAGGGACFPMHEARESAARLRRAFASGTDWGALSAWHLARTDVVLMAGRRVATAFGPRTRALPWFAGHEWGFEGLHGPRVVRFYAVPHPSGINRWWNNQINRDRALRFLAEVHARVEVERVRTLRSQESGERP